MRSWIWLCTLAACGRINFDPGGVVATDRIVLKVVAHQPDGTAVPFEGVGVLLDDGAVEYTDALGELVIDAPEPRTFHVVHPIATGHRVTSFVEVAGGTEVLAGPRAYDDRATSTFQLAFPMLASTQYQVALSTRCVFGDLRSAGSSPFMLEIANECLGQPLVAFVGSFVGGAIDQIAGIQFVPTAGGNAALPAWEGPAVASTLTVRNLPATTTELFVTGLTVTGDDVLNVGQAYLVPPYAEPIAVAEQLTGMATAIGVFARGPASFQSSSLVQATPTLDLDAAQLLPFTTAAFDPASRTITWEPVPSDIQRVEGLQTSGTEWIAYAPTEIGSVTFPTLPAELADADPGANPSWRVTTNAIDVLGMETTELLGIVDREWLFWSSWDARLPAQGLRVAGVPVNPTAVR